MIDLYTEIIEENNREALKELCRTDLFFLLLVGCNRVDLNRDWLYDRCKEIEANPDGYLDLWARGHGKSSIITCGKTIQDILVDPEIAIGIFSHTRPIAKAFLAQIKRELETNEFLQDLFPEILYKEPHRESPSWSLDSGIIVKRQCNKKEHTVESFGLVDGSPISRHYDLMIYDDTVTRESVTTSEQIKKVRDAWALSLNLKSENARVRYIGTRYHSNDLYSTIIERKAAIPRIYPATVDGTPTGEPVLLTREELEEKRQTQGNYIFAAQMLQNPLADSAMGFKEEWLNYLNSPPENTKGWNHYVVCDPATSKKKTSDYTVILVIALAPDNNYYLINGIRDRLNLTERAEKIFDFVERYHPLAVGYEKYGLQSDTEFLGYLMDKRNYRFNLTELGGSMSKEDRIRKLVPIFENGRFWIPRKLLFSDYEGKSHDLIAEFVNEEYLMFPYGANDDMLDAMARIVDPKLLARFPKTRGINRIIPGESDIDRIIRIRDARKKKESQMPRTAASFSYRAPKRRF